MENASKMTSSLDDGAAEKLVSGDKNGHPNKENIEVKFMSADSQNGDAKIDIENLKCAFAGMGKEELMKFANDPFWIRMRWFLFILFWLIWGLMLGGAIAIIVLAPKCAAPSPREWWQQSPLYEVDVRLFKDGDELQDGIGDIKGLQSKLDYIKGLGVETILISSVLKGSGDKNEPKLDTEDFLSVDPVYGTLDDFKQLLKSVKEKDLHLLMSFVPNHSSSKHAWFMNSIKKKEPYTSFYVWAPSRGMNADGNPTPPNNWLSVSGGSAWEWQPDRAEFYLHQFGVDQPDFNFHNPQVVAYFEEVFKFWLDTGVNGFHLEQAEYLLEDAGLANETVGSIAGKTHDEYNFYNHARTSHHAQLPSLLARWAQLIRNHSGVLSVGVLGSERNVSAGQLLHRPVLLQEQFTAQQLDAAISSRLSPPATSVAWPTWQFECTAVSADCMPDELASGLIMIGLLLPGTPFTHAGQELGLTYPSVMPWDNSAAGGFTSGTSWREANSDFASRNAAKEVADADSYYAMYKALVELRKSPSVMYGATQTSVLSPTVFAFTRIKSGNPGVVAVLNVGEFNVTVSLQKLESVPTEVSVIARTLQLRALWPLKSKVSSEDVTLPPKSGGVFSFVPIVED